MSEKVAFQKVIYNSNSFNEKTIFFYFNMIYKVHEILSKINTSIKVHYD